MTYSQAEDALSGPTTEERLSALEVLLRHPLEEGLRDDLRRMYLDITEQLHAKEQAA